MALDDERDFGFSRFGQGGFTGGTQKHDMAADPTFAGDFGASQMGVASSADIADLLESAADAGIDPVAVRQQADALQRVERSNWDAIRNEAGELVRVDNYGSSFPYVSQNYSDFGTAGINVGGQRTVSRGLNYADAMAIEARRQELSDELNRLNAISVQASNATDPYPSSWTSPDEWGMQDVRAAGMGPSPQDAQARLGDPVTPLGADVTRSVFPSPLTSVADYPAGDELGMQDVRVNPLNPSPLMSVADYPGGDDWGMPNVGLTQASIAEGVMGAPGTYSEYLGDRARDASLAFDEYDIPSRQQAEILSRPDEWGMPDYTPGSIAGQGRLDREGTGYYDSLRPGGRLDQEGTGYYDNLIGSSRPVGRLDQEGSGYYDNIVGGRTDREGGSLLEPDLETEEAAWRIANDPDIEDYIAGTKTAKDIMKVRTKSDVDNLVNNATKALSKRLTEEEKKD